MYDSWRDLYQGLPHLAVVFMSVNKPRDRKFAYLLKILNPVTACFLQLRYNLACDSVLQLEAFMDDVWEKRIFTCRKGVEVTVLVVLIDDYARIQIGTQIVVMWESFGEKSEEHNPEGEDVIAHCRLTVE